MAPSEYSYFRADALEIWAGPSHWKIKPYKGAVCSVLFLSIFFFLEEEEWGGWVLYKATKLQSQQMACKSNFV
jgi:hypothetical protein